MKLVGKTDIGNQRTENQDNYRAGRQPDETVWALVCDGMGGAQGGKLASGIAAAALEEFFAGGIGAVQSADALKQFMLEAIRDANSQIYARAQQMPAARGMGTTVVCCVVRDGMLHYAHVGDSRAYLYRGGTLRQLTKDHSMVQELVEQGSITEEEAAHHPHKNLITRALGVAKNVEIDYSFIPVLPDDIVLLCSDGLTNCVASAQMAVILQQEPFYNAAAALVQSALDAGGQDNITVLLVKVETVEDK